MKTTTKYTLGVTLSFTVLMGALLPKSCSVDVQPYVAGEVTREEDRNGWAGPELAAEAFAAMPDEEIAYFDAPDQPIGKRVVLWDLAKQVNDNNHLPTFRQVIGDCVDASSMASIEYLMANQAASGNGTWRPLFHGYTYGCSRNAPDIGKRRFGNNPNGNVGAWQALAAKTYGVLPADLEGLPAYSREQISQWAIRMPEAKWVEKGRLRVVNTIARVKSSTAVRAAVQNYYPATIASSAGFVNDPKFLAGRHVRFRSGTWGHQMCVIGYDYADLGDGKGPQELFYILNSWGANWGPTPPDGAPPGGFWCTAKDMDWITESGDCWSYADGPTFEKRDLFDVWQQGPPEEADAGERKTEMAL